MGRNILHYVLNRDYDFEIFKMIHLAGAPIDSSDNSILVLAASKKKDFNFLKLLI